MGLIMRLKPEDFHPALHLQIDVTEPIPFDLSQDVR
jgi:hypothetical protein